jgi:acyl-coenzyme A synthetase/AMP-(fatty) acid ligase
MTQRSATRPLNRLRFILDRRLTVANLLDKAVEAHDDTPLFLLDEPVPYGDLGDRIEPRRLKRFADAFGALLQGRCLMQRYDRVAILKANHGDYFFLGLAVMRAGGVAVPINGGLPSATVDEYLRYTGATILITDAETLVRLDRARAVPETIRRVLLSDPTVPRVGREVRARVRSLAAELAEPRAAEFRPVTLVADDNVLICHTSGTTGTPKGVLHTTGTLVAGIRGQLKIEPIFRRSVALNASPFNHFINYLGLMSSLVAQVPVWLVGRHDPGALLDLIDREAISVVFCFPHTYVAIYEHGLDRHDLGSVRLWLAGADSSHEAHIRPFVQRGAFLRLLGRPLVRSVYVDTFGSSEVGFAALFRFAFSFSTRFGRYAGRPTFAGPKIKVADARGRALPPGTVGRLMVKGPTLFRGYWNAHDKLQGVVLDGWWWTGDVGYRSHSGRFYHVDREVDVIRGHAGPVYSLPIEELVLNCDGVAEAVVIGVATEHGQAPIALVQTMDGCEVDVDALREEVNASLPPESRLARVTRIDRAAIPRGLTGKVLKRVLRERYDGTTRLAHGM